MGILNRVIVSPTLTHAFLKSSSSRGLSAIAELLVKTLLYCAVSGAATVGVVDVLTLQQFRSECSTPPTHTSLGYLLICN